MHSDVLIFLGMVFTAVLLLAQSTIMPMFGENRNLRKRMKRRLKTLGDYGSSAGASLIREKFLTNLAPWERRLESIPPMPKLARLIEQAGYGSPAYRVVLLSLTLGFIAAVAGFTATRMLLVALAAGGAASILPTFKLLRDRRKRAEQFDQRFPEALDLMVRGLRAGHPFSESLHVAATELDGAVSRELAIVFYDINFGGDVRRALLNLLDRMPSVTVTAFVTSVLIQRETGGNLAELLDKLGKTIRARFSFQGTVKSASAEGRMSAWVLTLIPFALAAMIAVVNPEYLASLTKDPKGHQIIGTAFGLLLLGVLWIRRIIRIDV